MSVQKNTWTDFFANAQFITTENPTLWNGTGIFDPLIDGKIINFEVDNILARLNKHTSPGPDLIPAFLLKNPSNKWREVLLNALNQILSHQVIPKDWT